MRSVMVVIHPPRFDLAPRIVNRQELIGVQTFIAQLPVEGLVAAIFYGLAARELMEVEARNS